MKIFQLKTSLLVAFLGFTFVSMAQTDNVFLERSYWGKSPTVADVEAKMAEGFDATAKNGRGFDGVTNAILADAPNETINYLLTLDGNDANKITHDGRNYIFWAAYKGNLPIMKSLVEHGSSIELTDSHGNTPLTFAASNGVMDTKVYDYLIDKGADVNFTQEHGATALLLMAANDKGFAMTKYFMGKGLDLYATDKEGNSAFNYAARTGNIEMMDMLIDRDVAYKTLNKEGGNAMFFAARGTRRKSNPLSVYTYLESKGVQPNVTTVTGSTPLHVLARSNKDMEVLGYFLKSGVDPNQVDEAGNNVLMVASSGNDFKVVELFAGQTKNINAENKDGQTALNNAVSGNSVDVVRFLTTKGAKPNNLSGEALIASVDGDDLNDFQLKMRSLKSVGFESKSVDKAGNTLLHYAAGKNNVALMKLLSTEGIDVNAKNKEGYTALMIAAMQSSDDSVLQFLVAQGADLSVQTDFEETAFDLASENELMTENKVDLKFLKN